MESLEIKCINERLRHDLMRINHYRVNSNDSGRTRILDEIKEPFENAYKLFSEDILPKIKSGYVKIIYLFSRKNG